MSDEPSVTQRNIGAVAPKLAELTDDVLFGDVWERRGLSKRDRSLITVAALVALYRPEQLDFHLRRALDNGVTRDEIVEIITHLAFYAGWPNAMTAINLARTIFGETDAPGSAGGE
ncbi:MAG: 4-carboxymuconolactone decarboxylase [Actinomycetota bacterium]|jgi:4-carboxymuconolactone decarboxylase|nr:4-carboxymuconolactone decarboxylase [Actinomycetota bacterium]MDQ1384463.1 4-carboxymuconolactone decarboxylase [Actinomycetota bacterium]